MQRLPEPYPIFPSVWSACVISCNLFPLAEDVPRVQTTGTCLTVTFPQGQAGENGKWKNKLRFAE